MLIKSYKEGPPYYEIAVFDGIHPTVEGSVGGV